MLRKPMRMRKVSPEVFITDEPIVRFTRGHLADLKKLLPASRRGRVRSCAHRSAKDPLHEMIIAFRRDSYIQPHRHFDKSEAFHVIEGQVDIVLFDRRGRIRDVIPLGPCSKARRAFFYRIEEAVFHTLVIRTPRLVLHEITRGPFREGDAAYAPWAPKDDDPAAAAAFMRELARRVDAFLRKG